MTAAPQISAPTVGFFKRRLVRNGPWVACRVFWSTPERDEAGDLIEDERLLCEVNGAPADAFEQWSYLADRRIDEAEYRYLLAVARHAEQHDPDAPEATPRQAIDLNALPPLFGPGGRYS